MVSEKCDGHKKVFMVSSIQKGMKFEEINCA